MDVQSNEEVALAELQLFRTMQTNGNFEIVSCDGEIDFENNGRFTELKLNSEQKQHVSALLQHIPSAIAAGAMAQTYTVKFPNGLPNALVPLKQGGFSSLIREDGGLFVGTASFYPALTQAALLGAFTAMSVASGQYFLSEINNELKMMKLNIDKILEFLYGDKKAELMSEISFARQAHQNYNSIMAHEQQRVATIVGLQEAKKVAMKDIEFYIVDLTSTVDSKDNSDINSLVSKAFQIKESLDLSMQLYVISNLLEVYYAQNYDSDYIQHLEGNIFSYIDKCEKRMLSSFSVLGRRIGDYKGKVWEKVDKSSHEQQVGELLELLNSGNESSIRKSVHSVLRATTRKEEYYITNSGNVYFKTS
jgi:hypothetical protein